MDLTACTGSGESLGFVPGFDDIVWREYNVSSDSKRIENETWTSDPERWHEWNHDSLLKGARFFFEAHEHEKIITDDFCENDLQRFDFDFPVFVLNLAHREDRKTHMQRMLMSIGFSNISFLNSTPAEQIDVDSLLSNGVIFQSAAIAISKFSGPAAVGPYIAHALDRIDALRLGLSTSSPLFAIFEDDLSLGACPAQVPPSACM
jgi:hypothetical protein